MILAQILLIQFQHAQSRWRPLRDTLDDLVFISVKQFPFLGMASVNFNFVQ